MADPQLRHPKERPVIHDMKCSRHPDRDAEYCIVSHYIDGSLLQAVKADQILDVLCSGCRLELLGWITHRVDQPR